ncbi:MAG: beta-exotoxin transport system permease protein [Chloroflexota bacterium]|jgi:ABC-2 type transport system permease protein|nr:beta-exotoxin transport system permease protein [Chloroflexota bacterium]
MNAALFAHLWRSQRTKLLIVCVAILAWSAFLPVIYQSFGSQMKALVDSGIIPREITNIGGGDVFSLGGSIALGYVHPIAIILVSMFAIGFAASAVAGERQRGTLEVLLARPVSRRGLYVTVLAAALLFVALVLAAASLGTIVGAAIAGVIDELPLERLPMLWLNGMLLWGTFAAIALAASVSFDRLTPAIGATLAIVVVMYFLDILGSLWPDAKGLQPYSLFHYLTSRDILAGTLDPVAFAVLAIVGAGAIVYALIEFPRRDLAAPS